MATKSLRCFVEIDIRAVTSPGTWLPKRDDVFVSVSLFGQVRQTRMAGSVFPLLFHDRLKFDKVFYSAYEPSQIAEKLLEETIRIELLQLSSLFLEGRLLAWYESNAKIFLYPSPYFTFSYGLNGREIVMERSLSFPGISPRMEFSTKTVIHETSSLYNPLGYLTSRNSSIHHDTDGYWPNNTTGKRNQRSSSPLKSYGRSTLSSALKSKTRFDDVNDDAIYISDDLYASTSKSLQDRPPFVVRKVEDDLVARKPSPLYPRIRPRSSERRSDRRLLTRSRSLSPTKHFDSSYANNDQGSQEFVNNLDHQSSLGRYHDDYTTQMDLIRARIDRALRRNRSMERMELLEKMKSYYRWPFYYDYLDDLELELELGRRRRRFLLY